MKLPLTIILALIPAVVLAVIIAFATGLLFANFLIRTYTETRRIERDLVRRFELSHRVYVDRDGSLQSYSKNKIGN